jgi:hypothetical protein
VVGGGRSHTAFSRTLSMLLPLLTSLIAMAIPAKSGPCPAGVVNQLDGLYRWQVQRMEKRIDPVKDLSSQRQRFTPSLFKLLIEARALTPVRDGRYLDFDVFSNTQSETLGAQVKSCSAGKRNSLKAEVEVEVGLRGRSSGIPRRLQYEMNQDSKGSWRINDITYGDEQSFKLRPFLKELLNPSS